MYFFLNNSKENNKWKLQKYVTRTYFGEREDYKRSVRYALRIKPKIFTKFGMEVELIFLLTSLM